MVCATATYNVACFYSLKNDTANALRMLDLSYEFNPASQSYVHIQQDTDLDNVRHTAHYAQYAERVRQQTDYLFILRQSPAYATGEDKRPRRFTYAPAADSSLVRIKEYFNLDSIAGNGDKVSRIKNIMYWLHDEIRHDGSSAIPNVPRTAIDLYKACKAENRELNCRGLAIVLSELYLAMGYPARFITCQSKAHDTDPDCHVICVVWSKELDRWVWMDPMFAAYVSDDNGQLLSIAEVRERLRDGRPLCSMRMPTGTTRQSRPRRSISTTTWPRISITSRAIWTWEPTQRMGLMSQCRSSPVATTPESAILSLRTMHGFGRHPTSSDSLNL